MPRLLVRGVGHRGARARRGTVTTRHVLRCGGGLDFDRLVAADDAGAAKPGSRRFKSRTSPCPREDKVLDHHRRTRMILQTVSSTCRCSTEAPRCPTAPALDVLGRTCPACRGRMSTSRGRARRAIAKPPSQKGSRSSRRRSLATGARGTARRRVLAGVSWPARQQLAKRLPAPQLALNASMVVPQHSCTLSHRF
jgi:hypothetical protein